MVIPLGLFVVAVVWAEIESSLTVDKLWSNVMSRRRRKLVKINLRDTKVDKLGREIKPKDRTDAVLLILAIVCILMGFAFSTALFHFLNR